ncbi:MAG: FkbM family methyltransferase [Phycisphaerae bacterium]|nr:FkbM family methyltransferase [Phycisphaerae bacterium]
MPLFELLPGWLDRFAIPRTGLIVVGAHEGQELPHYTRAGFARQLWIEPQPAPFARLTAALPPSPDIRAFNLACGPDNGTATMFTLQNNQGLSNSLLPPNLHLREYPDMPPGEPFQVPVVRLDDLLTRERLDPAAFSFLVMDVQGYELHVLRGAPALLASGASSPASGLQAILTEVSTAELYKGCALLPDMDAHLAAAGFTRVITRLNRHHYGDALYVRAEHLSPAQRLRLRLLGPGRR